MKIIVNADDYGYTNGIVDAIVKGHQEGIITSTTVMCNVPDLGYALEKSRLCPDTAAESQRRWLRLFPAYRSSTLY